MLVFRVEHKISGTGPYLHSDPENDYVNIMGLERAMNPFYGKMHPDPDYQVPSSHYFGFASAEDLCFWFNVPMSVRELDSLGFEVRTYYITDDKVKVLPKQLAFEKDAAELISRQPMFDFVLNAFEIS